MKIFKDYKSICYKQKSLSYKIEEIDNKLYGLKAKISEFKSQNYVDNKIYLISQKDALEREFKALEEKRNALYKECVALIDKLDNENEKQVLRCVYLYQMRYDQIAELMDLTSKTIANIRYRADTKIKDTV